MANENPPSGWSKDVPYIPPKSGKPGDAMLPTKKRLKLLAYCDSPVCSSGFGQVSKNILNSLHKTGLFDITVFGINHKIELDDYGRFEELKVPYEILPASYLTIDELEKGYSDDQFGKSKLMKLMYKEDYDVFWSLQDPYVVGFLEQTFKALRKFGKTFISMLYFPVDASDISEEWATIPALFDYPIVYTEIGKAEVMKHLNKIDVGKIRDRSKMDRLKKYEENLKVIPHGTNTEDFYPMDDEKKKRIRAALQIPDDTCLVINVNRNQPRKDIARSLQIFAKFKEKVPNSVLFLYCRSNDMGGNLETRMKYYGLKSGVDVIFPTLPKGEKAFKGTPVREVNQAYNASDMVISTTLGEGWGLSLTEGMATKTPVVFPANSSINEILGDNERGFKVKCGSTTSEWIHQPFHVDDPVRPLTNVDDMVEKMLYVWNNKDKPEVLDKVNKAYEWALEHTWDKIFAKYWLPMFTEIYKKLT